MGDEGDGKPSRGREREARGEVWGSPVLAFEKSAERVAEGAGGSHRVCIEEEKLRA